MTAPTHGAFAGVLALLFGMPIETSICLIIGSILPDIDHQKSFVGRLFFFISHPINKRFGHRQMTHSLILWLPIMAIGFVVYKPIYWVVAGVMTHLFLDMWNLTGVGLFRPITDKVFVMSQKKYRIKVGSKNEFVLMVVFLIATWASYEVYSLGGFRSIIRDMMGDYNMVLTDYQKAGLKLSYIEGKLRGTEGSLRDVKYLIIGNGLGSGHLILYDEVEGEVIEVPKQGKFLKARYREGKGVWSTLKVKEPLTIDKIEGMAFNRASKKWRKVEEGDIVMGDINYIGSVSLR